MADEPTPRNTNSGKEPEVQVLGGSLGKRIVVFAVVAAVAAIALGFVPAVRESMPIQSVCSAFLALAVAFLLVLPGLSLVRVRTTGSESGSPWRPLVAPEVVLRAGALALLVVLAAWQLALLAGLASSKAVRSQIPATAEAQKAIQAREAQTSSVSGGAVPAPAAEALSWPAAAVAVAGVAGLTVALVVTLLGIRAVASRDEW